MFVDATWTLHTLHYKVPIFKQSFADHVLLAQWKSQDGPQFMAEEAKAYGYPFPYLYDEVGPR